MLKKPDKEDYSNLLIYKPIILFNIFNKILEAVILNRIKYIIESYDLLLNLLCEIRLERIIETDL
jgi:hypothetical protein